MWTKKLVELMVAGGIPGESLIDSPAYRLKEKNLPQKLYKFRAISDYAISNFESDTVWLCSADKFNDPYECATAASSTARLDSSLEETKVKLRRNFELWRNSNGWMDIPERELDELVEKICPIITNKIDEITVRHLNNFRNESAQRVVKVCSFSSRLDSIVMWGHYAKLHTGFAIEYDVKSWHRRIVQMLYPVIYQNELFDLADFHLQMPTTDDLSCGRTTPRIMAAIHKSLDWSYENEWRFVYMMSDGSPDENYSVPKPSAVYVGSRIIPADKERICEIASRKMIPVYQMSLSAHEYKLVPHETSVKNPTFDDEIKRAVDWTNLQLDDY